ncbi:hypothetical protein B0H17DRAFT_1326041 [Mycena rosella]|uniref:RING-type domain-containing protein n=1 Tax=Mycena rosella TaxID=1033263 RepID=A0AAD7GVS8_MYCRO|nr:hypothetical protein B0H17DRAFT_1326041 [Mycena rosella]
MPLVLHSSSCCDVCLESYSWNPLVDDALHPHAIPCGHIFCRTCLVTVEPTNCPLCRKAFNRERIKKLHIDRPEIDPEADLLHRVAFAYEAEDDTKLQLSTDIEAWLTGRPDDDHLALRKSWAAFQAHTKLAEKRAIDKRKIKRCEHILNQRIQENEEDRDTFKAIESSLRDQVSQLTAYVFLFPAASSLTCAVVFPSRQMADLEAQVNPLRLELTKLQHLSRYQHTNNPLPPPPEPIPLDRFPAFARATAESAEGYAAYFTPDDGKGKQPVYNNIYQQNPTGNVIIPGATPSQRVIPTEVPNGYANGGFGLGYGAASTGVEADANYASTSAHQLPPPPQPDEEVSLENVLGTMRIYGAATASAAIAPVVPRPPDSAPGTMPLRRRPAYVAPSHTSTEDDVRSTVQIDGQAPSARQPPPIYAAPAHSDALVRFQAQDGGQAVANDATERRAAHERHRTNRRSYSSWGTVHTNPAENSPAGTRGSMSEIGDLANFPLMPSGDARRTSTSSLGEMLDRGLSSTPRPEDARPLGFREAAPVRPGHVHSQPLSSLEMADATRAYDANSLQRANRTDRRSARFSQLPAGTPTEFGMAAEPPPIQNALGLDLGMAAAAEPLAITAPTPRVQTTHYLRSWSESGPH